ncbi:unnamed protein product, partial [Owenia fusiformis]
FQNMAANVRQRTVHGQSKNVENNHFFDADLDKTNGRERRYLKEYIWLIVFLFVGSCFAIIHFEDNRFPEAKTVANANPEDFVEERARQYLLSLTDLGPRPVGSHANEVLAPKILLEHLHQIKSRLSPASELEIDVQNVTGSFTLKFLGEFSSYYENVNNVLAKLGPKGGSQHSLLVNCHYDSVIDSPGASDDAISCALMMEALNVLATRPYALPHNVIFIFNGAEENILQASHGFITQHPWAKSVRAFYNLEAAGAGGRELVFQTGPEHPWLIQTYAQSAKYPFASIFGQEVFESGLIPSDTDFRIYRDYGGVPGIDVAYVSNGYVYHTKYDDPDRIPPGCMQRGGENLLSSIKALASSPYLAEPGEYRHGTMVFFDFIGYFLVLYPERMGIILNSMTVLVVFIGILRKVVGRDKMQQQGFQGSLYIKHLMIAAGFLLFNWTLVILTSLALGFFMYTVGRPMCWFSHHLFMVPMYVVPGVLLSLTLHSFIKEKFYKNVFDLYNVERVYFDAHICMVSLLLGFMTYKGVCSAVIVLVWVLFPLCIRDRGCQFLNVKLSGNPTKLLTVHLVSLAFPSLIGMYPIYGVTEMFVPVMGRVGTEAIPDVFIAGLMAVSVVSHMGYHIGLIYITENLSTLRRGLLAIFLFFLALMLFTPLGFPYRANEQFPTKQRSILHHIDRRIHNLEGQITKEDSGIWLIPFDQYSIEPLKQANVSALQNVTPLECSGPYCGVPYYFPMLMLMRTTYYLPAPKLNAEPRVAMTWNREINGNRQRLTFEATGPNHINVFIQLRDGVSIVEWSIGSGHPSPTLTPDGIKEQTYFIYYSYGSKPQGPWKFWIDVQVSPDVDTSNGILELALAGHYAYGPYKMTAPMQEFIDTLPDWSYPVGWSATYDSWVF